MNQARNTKPFWNGFEVGGWKRRRFQNDREMISPDAKPAPRVGSQAP
jgi:hypothetical protein